MIFLFLFILSIILFPQGHSKIAKPSTQNYSLLYITHGLNYIDRDQKNSKLDQTKFFILLDQDITKRIELRKKIEVMV